MFKSLLSALCCVLFLSSCQKEIGPVAEADRQQNNADSVASIVFDGLYDGTFKERYDSAVIRFGNSSALITHYTAAGTLYGTETLLYDGQNRVTNFRFRNIVEGSTGGRAFLYDGSDAFPRQILDTFVHSFDDYTQSVVLGNPVSSGGLRQQTVYNETVYADASLGTFRDTGAVWLTATGRLARYENTQGFESRYFYNASLDIDSSIAVDAYYGGQGYFTATYTSTANPFSDAARLVYKNLYPLLVTDQLDNSALEALLDVSYLPSPLLSVKTPLRSTFWYNGPGVEEEFNYAYTVQNNLLTKIALTHRHVATGVITPTELRFRYQ